MKKNIPLIVGIALPFIFIIVIALVVYLPNAFINPQYDFLFTTGDRYSYNYLYRNIYDIENNKLISKSVTISTSTDSYGDRVIEDAPKLYRYNMKENSIKEISFAEAQKFSLDPGPTSPDGYIVTYKYGHDGIFELFGSNNNNDGYFISKGNGGKKLQGMNSTEYRYYGENFKFIGWIK